MSSFEEFFERLRLQQELFRQNGFGAGRAPYGSSSTPQISEINQNNFICRAGVLFAKDPNDTYLHTRIEKIKVTKIIFDMSDTLANFLLAVLKPLPLVTDRDSARVIELGKAIESAVKCAAGDFTDKLFGLRISSYGLKELHQYPVYGDNGEVGWVRYKFIASDLSAALTLGELELGGKEFEITCQTEYFVFESFEALEEAYKEMKSGR